VAKNSNEGLLVRAEPSAKAEEVCSHVVGLRRVWGRGYISRAKEDR
jgi:hypothetical protein